MKKGQLITGVALGTAVALFLIPKTRRMITGAVSGLTDSLKDWAGHAMDMAKNGNRMSVKS